MLAVGRVDSAAGVMRALHRGVAQVREREALLEEPAPLGGSGDEENARAVRVHRDEPARVAAGVGVALLVRGSDRDRLGRGSAVACWRAQGCQQVKGMLARVLG